MADLQDLQILLQRAAQELPKQALTIIGVESLNFVNKNFKEESFTDVGRENWQERKSVDKRGRDITRYRTNRVGKAGSLNRYGSKIEGRALLTGHATGGDKLRNSFKRRIDLGSKKVIIYTYKQYAQRHNEGLDGMPRRQFMGNSKYLNAQIYKKIEKKLNELLK